MNEPCLLDQPLAIVDLETTGMRPNEDRVIEIALLLVDAGGETARYTSLLQPDTDIPPFISELTGLYAPDLAGAPRFADIADALQRQLAGRLFVAHNAPFDYGFLAGEFARLGQPFERPQLCTVRLSRRLFPEWKGHGLDAISARLGIRNAARHRALGDALATFEFLQHCRRECSVPQLNHALRKQLEPERFLRAPRFR